MKPKKEYYDGIIFIFIIRFYIHFIGQDCLFLCTLLLTFLTRAFGSFVAIS